MLEDKPGWPVGVTLDLFKEVHMFWDVRLLSIKMDAKTVRKPKVSVPLSSACGRETIFFFLRNELIGTSLMAVLRPQQSSGA